MPDCKDRCDDRFDRIDEKFDRIDSRLEEITRVLERNTASLEIHMKRSDQIEEQVEVLQGEVAEFRGFLAAQKWVIGTMLAVATVIIGILNYFKG